MKKIEIHEGSKSHKLLVAVTVIIVGFVALIGVAVIVSLVIGAFGWPIWVNSIIGGIMGFPVGVTCVRIYNHYTRKPVRDEREGDDEF